MPYVNLRPINGKAKRPAQSNGFMTPVGCRLSITKSNTQSTRHQLPHSLCKKFLSTHSKKLIHSIHQNAELQPNANVWSQLPLPEVIR
ncbi:hypothetical protein FKM82_007590 [Ascaphus truei]